MLGTVSTYCKYSLVSMSPFSRLSQNLFWLKFTIFIYNDELDSYTYGMFLPCTSRRQTLLEAIDLLGQPIEGPTRALGPRPCWRGRPEWWRRSFGSRRCWGPSSRVNGWSESPAWKRCPHDDCSSVKTRQDCEIKHFTIVTFCFNKLLSTDHCN